MYRNPPPQGKLNKNIFKRFSGFERQFKFGSNDINFAHRCISLAARKCLTRTASVPLRSAKTVLSEPSSSLGVG